MCFTQVARGEEVEFAMDSLTQLVDVLAENPHLAKERLGWIQAQASFQNDDYQHLIVTTSQLQGVLAIARFLSSCEDLQYQSDLLDVLLKFLKAVPSLTRLSAFPEWFTFDAATVYFTEMSNYVVKIVDSGFTDNTAISAAVCSTITMLVFQESRAKITEAGRALLTALSHVCPRLMESDIDQVGRCLFEHNLSAMKSGWTPRAQELPVNAVKEGLLKQLSATYGEKGLHETDERISNQDRTVDLARKLEDSSLDDESQSSTSSSTPVSGQITSASFTINGNIPHGNSASNFTSPQVSDEEMISRPCDLHDKDLAELHKQGVAFRIFASLLNMAGSGFLSEEHVVLPLKSAATTQLKSVPVILKYKRRDLLSDTLKINMKFQVCQAAASVFTRAFLLLKQETKGQKNTLRETLGCLIDAANACAMSSCRRLRVCQDLFNCLVLNVASISSFCEGQDLTALLSWLKKLVMAACAQVDPWSNSHCLQSIVEALCRIVRSGWTTDRSAVESFLLSLSGSVYESNELEEKERHAMATMQLNIVRFLAELVVCIGRPEVAEMICPLLIENLEEGIASAPSRLRLKLLDAVARIAIVGSEKSYRETIILLTRSYLDRVSDVGLTQSRILAAEAKTEREETLPRAFLTIASDLSDVNLRADYQLRLLQLCSDVGLAAESSSSDGGAGLLGPLLPAVAELCLKLNFPEQAPSLLLKLYRNLWFYMALFGLAPSMQTMPLPHKGTRAGGTNAASAQPVEGPFMWNPRWFAAVIQITQGTPPLVASSLKWVEDELELNELHNPGNRRPNGSEKVASSQKAALSAALKDHIDTSSLSTVSGVKATFLLAVAFLEILRLNYNGGVLKSMKNGEKRSALSCAFEYLEKPNLPSPMYQCLSAIVHRAFDASLSWLDERNTVTGVAAAEKDLVIVTHTCFLLSKLTHIDERVCDLSCKFLNQIKAKYPQVLWHRSCLDSLFGQVQYQPQPSLDSVRVSFMHSLIKNQIRTWITQSLAVAPCTTQGLLQERIRFANSSLKGTHTSDLLPILSDIKLESSRTDGVGGSYMSVVVPPVFAAAAAAAGARENLSSMGSLEVLSNGIVSANVKSSYVHINIGGLTFGQGQLLDTAAGLLLEGSRSDSFKERKSEKITSAKNKLKEKMIASFLQLLQQFISSVERGVIVDTEAFRETCLRSAAFIVSELELSKSMEMEGFLQLVRLLCWCPAYICSSETMGTGVFIWTWLISAAPHLSSLLLAELVDAWLWSVETGRGLFASGPENSGPNGKLRPHLTPGDPISIGDRGPLEGIKAHRMWLGFFFDRFEVVRHNSFDQLLLIGRMLQGSLKSPNHFSSHPAATGAFFSLMVLGLKFCSCQPQISQVKCVDIWLLEDRIYRAALAWFSSNPRWYDLNSEAFAQGEAQAVAAFSQQITLEQSERLRVVGPSGKLYMQDKEASSSCSQIDGSHPVWGQGEDYMAGKEKRKHLLLMLCQHEAERLYTWANPLREGAPVRMRVSSERWIDFVRVAWSVDPCIAFALTARFRAVGSLRSEIASLVQEHIYDISDIPEALPFFITPKAAEENSSILQRLAHWAPCSITSALEFLTPAYKGHPRIMAYVLRVLEFYPPESVTFFMPQLVQSLRYDDGGLIERYLITAAQRSHLFAHILIWQLQGEEPAPSEDFGKEQLQERDLFHDFVLKVRERIIERFNPVAFDMFEREFRFFEKVTNISGVLYPVPKEQRRAGIKRELEKIEVEGDDLYLPTAPNKLVRGIQVNSGIPLQSAAKVPIMVTFDVVDKHEPNVIRSQACIFKVGDDCRQDVLALQVISLLRDIFKATGLNLYLFPYGVLPTGCGKGIIEVVPNTRSRNQMGEMTDGGLLEIFEQDYGPVGSPQFEAARDNFIVSSAGYAVASLLLQPKDRHNGNLLFDNEGRLVHIDFGFILETSPGGNLRFENAQFKLSHEMTQLLDPSGVMKSDTWIRFVSLCVKGFLAARQHMDGIVNTVLLMVDSGLPCFSRGDPIGNLRKRFHPEMSDHEAANFMIKTCADAYNKWTTAGYDLIQYLQQGIEK